MAQVRDPRAVIEERVAAHCAERSLMAPGDRILLAVSGGPDSVALVSIMTALGERLGLSFHVGHLNHMLRGRSSDEDAAFVDALCAKRGLECTVSSVDVRARQCEAGGSLEAVAHDVRSEFLSELAGKVAADKIATGHQRDDVAETVMMRLLRGAGSAGLSGLRPVRDGRWIRPLLVLSRADVIAYLQSAGASYRHDASNSDMRFLRNRVRHELLPDLANAYNPKVSAALARAGTILSDEDEYLQGVADATYAEIETHEGLDVARLTALPRAIERRVVRRWLEACVPHGRAATLDEVEWARRFARSRAGASAMLTRRLRLAIDARSDGRAVLTAASLSPASTKAECRSTTVVEVRVPGETSLDGHECGVAARVVGADVLDVSGLPKSEAAFDMRRVPEPLTLRAWRTGDRLHPFGMAGSKRVAALLCESGVPSWRRDRVVVLCGGSEVIWVVGYRADGRYAVTSDTAEVLHVRAFRPVGEDDA